MVEREAMKGYSVLADFLDEVKLRKTAEKSGEAANKAKVQISTIHSAKGGEWDIVFNARFNEGFHPVIPFAMKIDYKAGRRVQYKMSELDMQRHLAEERRLAHVAFSRAKRRLVITYVRGIPNGPRGAWNAQELSSIALPQTAMYTTPRPETDVEKQAKQVGCY